MPHLVYFRRAGCPFCERFDPVWERAVVDVRLRDVTFERKTLTAKRLPNGVSSVPKLQLRTETGILIFGSSSSTVEDIVLRVRQDEEEETFYCCNVC